MMKEREKALWIGFGLTLAAGLLWLNHTGVLFTDGFTIAAGLLPNLTPPSSGRLALSLPAGAAWISAERSDMPNPAAAAAVSVPTAGDQPLVVASVAKGTTIAVQWRDAGGATQVTMLGFD